MDKKTKKNILLICGFVTVVHILGLIYQIIVNLPTISILLKELFVLIFISQFVLIKFEVKYYRYICSVLNLIVITISLIYMDFTSVIICFLLIIYLLFLCSNSNINKKIRKTTQGNSKIQINTINQKSNLKKSHNNKRQLK